MVPYNLIDCCLKGSQTNDTEIIHLLRQRGKKALHKVIAGTSAPLY